MTRFVNACLAVTLALFVVVLALCVVGFGYITLSMIGAI